MASHIPESTKPLGDAVSLVTVVGTVMEFLPAVAAILTIVWTLIRIWETETVQSLVYGKDRTKGTPKQ
jgi:hypothetical protein